MDKVGKLPVLKNKNHAFKEIIKITEDERSHVLLEDCYNWMKVKMKAIRLLAKKGILK